MSTPEQKLKRFLHYGREIPVYQPGDRLHGDVYQPSQLMSVEDLIANGKSAEAAACIVKAFSDGYSAHPEMLVYALAICAKQKVSQELTTAAYKALRTVCTTPENLFLFIKFASKLKPKSSVWGKGFRKVVKEWYLKKDPKTLAQLVSMRKSYHGWSHKDIIKLVHLKTDDPAKAAIIKYILYDIATAKKEYGETQGTNEVLNYLQSVEDFKHMTDRQQAARTLETLRLSLDHVPCHLLKIREIWHSLVGVLPLGTLIKNLERMGYLGFLCPKSPLVPAVLDALRDMKSVHESRLHPAQVFVALRKYETLSKFTAATDAQKRLKMENGSGESRKLLKAPPKPNSQILIALYQLFASTCKLFLVPTGLRYLVAIKMHKLASFKKIKNCYRCPELTTWQAAAVTTICLIHADQNVTVVAPNGDDTYVPLQITTNSTIKQAESTMMGHVYSLTAEDTSSPETAIKWALTNKKEYDVMVYITDIGSKEEGEGQNVANTLNEYRQQMNLPKAKLVMLSLMFPAEPKCATSADDPGIFDIAGFDGNVPRIIEAFSRGAF